MDNTGTFSQSFGPNWIRVALSGAATLAGLALATELDPGHASIPIWGVRLVQVAAVGLPLLVLSWLLTVRLRIDARGVRYRSLFGVAEMRWEEVDRYYFDVAHVLLNGIIPLGATHHFRLIAGIAGERRAEAVHTIGKVTFRRSQLQRGTAAKVLAFGGRFWNVEFIGRLIHHFTFPLLLRLAAEQYDSDTGADFECIRITRQGITADMMADFGVSRESWDQIPWSIVQSYRLERGRFVVRTTGGGRLDLPAASIPNLAAMMALLEQVKPQTTPETPIS